MSKKTELDSITKTGYRDGPRYFCLGSSMYLKQRKQARVIVLTNDL